MENRKTIYKYQLSKSGLTATCLPTTARATIAVILNKVKHLHYNLFDREPRIRRWQAGL